MIPLPRLPSEISRLVGPHAPVPTYRQIYTAVLDGAVKAHQKRNGRYEVDVHTLPHIIAHFGLDKATT